MTDSHPDVHENWVLTHLNDWATPDEDDADQPLLPPPTPVVLDPSTIEDKFDYGCPIQRTALSPTPISEASPHQATYICPETNAEFAWYYAIGSMINPTSLSLRKLQPIESYAAILRGWRLVFRGDCGMASILPSSSTLPSMKNHSIPREDFHGVLHRLSKEQMAKLDVIENSYERLDVYVECYDGRLQLATVYKMAESKLDPSKPDALPSERYLDIISRGCVHFGVHREYIEWLRSHKCIKRKRPQDYRKIPVHELHQSGAKDLQMTASELAKFDGRPMEEEKSMIKEEEEEETCRPSPSPSSSYGSPSSPSPSSSSYDHKNCESSPSPSPSPSPPPRRFYPLRIAVNKKILEWIGDLTQPLLNNTYQFIRENFGGTDLSYSYTCVFFEPLYPIVSSYIEMSNEHRLMVEDIFAEKVLNPNLTMREWKLVGFLSSEEQKESQLTGQMKLRTRRMGLVRTKSLGMISTAGGNGGSGSTSNCTTPRTAGCGGIDSTDVDSNAPYDDDLDDSSNMNMFLSLSMEDHSGASSTCFAFCCAGAQPFHAQRVLDHQLQLSMTPRQQTTDMRRIKRRRERERKRRHSIGNVGLHLQQQQQLNNHDDNEANNNANELYSDSTTGHGTTLSAHSSGSSFGPAASSSSSIGSVSVDRRPSPSPSRRTHHGGLIQPHPKRRSKSICSGQLAAAHTPTAMLSLCVSPTRKRINSADDLLVTSPSMQTMTTTRHLHVDVDTIRSPQQQTITLAQQQQDLDTK